MIFYGTSPGESANHNEMPNLPNMIHHMCGRWEAFMTKWITDSRDVWGGSQQVYISVVFKKVQHVVFKNASFCVLYTIHHEKISCKNMVTLEAACLIRCNSLACAFAGPKPSRHSS